MPGAMAAFRSPLAAPDAANTQEMSRRPVAASYERLPLRFAYGCLGSNRRTDDDRAVSGHESPFARVPKS